MAGDLEARGAADYLARLADLRLTAADEPHVRWWFRGQPEAGWDLAPGVYRPTFPAADEAARLRLEQHLYQDFRVMSAGLVDGAPSDVELYFLLQHVGLPTRLLDWTTNPLAALYFTANALPDRDGEVVLMDAHRMACGGAGPGRAVTSDDPRLADWLSPVLRAADPGRFAGHAVPVRPALFNPRMRLQRSCFTLHVPAAPRMAPGVNPTVRRVRVPAAAKAGVARDLKLVGIDEFTIFGDLDNLAVALKAAYRL